MTRLERYLSYVAFSQLMFQDRESLLPVVSWEAMSSSAWEQPCWPWQSSELVWFLSCPFSDPRALGRVLDLLSRGNKIFLRVVAQVGEVKGFKRLSSSNCSVDHGAVIIFIITAMIFTAAAPQCPEQLWWPWAERRALSEPPSLPVHSVFHTG